MSIFTTWMGQELEFDKLDQYTPRIEDVAHALSLLCRYRGQIDNLYSVAQHSLLVEKILQCQGHPHYVRLSGLLHDAPEMLISDCPSPLKQQMPEFVAMEDRIAKLFDWTFQVDSSYPEVKEADKLALYAESYHLFKDDTNSAMNPPYPPVFAILISTLVEDPKITEQKFLAKHWELKYLIEKETLASL